MIDSPWAYRTCRTTVSTSPQLRSAMTSTSGNQRRTTSSCVGDRRGVDDIGVTLILCSCGSDGLLRLARWTHLGTSETRRKPASGARFAALITHTSPRAPAGAGSVSAADLLRTAEAQRGIRRVPEQLLADRGRARPGALVPGRAGQRVAGVEKLREPHAAVPGDRNQRRGLHLHRDASLGNAAVHPRAGLPVERVGRPGPAA